VKKGILFSLYFAFAYVFFTNSTLNSIVSFNHLLKLSIENPRENTLAYQKIKQFCLARLIQVPKGLTRLMLEGKRGVSIPLSFYPLFFLFTPFLSFLPPRLLLIFSFIPSSFFILFFTPLVFYLIFFTLSFYPLLLFFLIIYF